MTRGPLTNKEIMRGLDNMPLPVGHYSRGGTFAEGVAYAERMHGITVCEEPEPEPEPINEEPAARMAVRSWGDDKEYWFKPLRKDLPIGEYELYTKPSPARKPWQSLTDEEFEDCVMTAGGLAHNPMFWVDLKKLIEEKLKDKNT